ncbi:cis-3-chloroacrylic acid dehalogenase [Mycobacterium ahvazicum]|uniref:Cis-3-chloroacrylic acid dehalogenase n=1 Tax=Mycobacterium ahvazicum TaxID=1964395 RepID=A0A2K4Y4W3_9MYCO|nr:tautomerase family protein [Mycobacterium ahvazicum]SOX51834.1 cis-3-chloroacrylic acid dehalogenase [Mycobacterium ahvazicum]
MPVYQCVSTAGLVSADARARIAEGITRLHCEVTGAPAAFVNVLFSEYVSGELFTGGQPSQNSFIAAEIRAGRDLDIRQALLRQLSAIWTEATGQNEAQLLVAIKETPAENAMEAGLMFPRPGEEAQWMSENSDKLAALGWTVST